MNNEKFEKFIQCFEKHLKEGHKKNPYLYKDSVHASVSKLKAQILARNITQGLASRAARNACVELGIPQTMTGIKKYVEVIK